LNLGDEDEDHLDAKRLALDEVNKHMNKQDSSDEDILNNGELNS